MKADEINFLPESVRLRETRRRRQARVLVGVGLASACLLGWGLAQRGSLAEQRDYARQVETEVAEAKAQATERGKLRNRYIELLRRDGVRSELTQAVSHARVLEVVAELLPASAGVTELEFVARRPEPEPRGDGKRPAARPATADAPPKREVLEFRLEGIAPDDDAVNDAVGGMTGHPLFSSVALEYSRDDEAFGFRCRRFVLRAEVDLRKRYVEAGPREVADAR